LWPLDPRVKPEDDILGAMPFYSIVMPALVAGIHEHLWSPSALTVVMDCRNKSGNDTVWSCLCSIEAMFSPNATF